MVLQIGVGEHAPRLNAFKLLNLPFSSHLLQPVSLQEPLPLPRCCHQGVVLVHDLVERRSKDVRSGAALAEDAWSFLAVVHLLCFPNLARCQCLVEVLLDVATWMQVELRLNIERDRTTGVRSGARTVCSAKEHHLAWISELVKECTSSGSGLSQFVRSRVDLLRRLESDVRPALVVC